MYLVSGESHTHQMINSVHTTVTFGIRCMPKKCRFHHALTVSHVHIRRSDIHEERRGFLNAREVVWIWERGLDIFNFFDTNDDLDVRVFWWWRIPVKGSHRASTPCAMVFPTPTGASLTVRMRIKGVLGFIPRWSAVWTSINLELGEKGGHRNV